MRKTKYVFFNSVIIWFVIIGIVGNMGLFSRLFSASDTQQQVIEDPYMTTEGYHTEIEVQSDNSYLVKESISVYFINGRHGIYRYIPQKGVITEVEEDGDIVDTPYYASFDSIKSTVPLDVSTDNGNKVFRFGEEDVLVSGKNEYQFQYRMTPVTSYGYHNMYYNVFPTGWQNEIPAGSTFCITFPDEFDHERLQLYYGEYGERLDGSDIVKLEWNGNTVTGTLLNPLPVGNGMTFYASMDPGYFEKAHSAFSTNMILIGCNIVILIVLLLLFLLFGRDKTIISSIQFQPPQGLDSAAVGYIIDGNISDTDVISLIIFWADRGFIKIRETKNKTLAFTKRRELPEDAPEYARRFFDGIFGKGEDTIGKEVVVSKLKYRMANTFQNTKELIKKQYAKQVYTQASKAARIVASVLSFLPIMIFVITMINMTFASGLVLLLSVIYLIGIVLFNITVDFWYSKAKSSRVLFGSAASALCIAPLVSLILIYGISMVHGTMLNLFPAMMGMTVVSVVGMVLTGFMKKRTDKCVEWMGYLAGLRDFIETAELERMQVIAEETPEMFYHILPFAYVFGLSDILLDKMKELTLPAPEWYETRGGDDYFDYYLMHRMLHTDMRHVATTIATPKPPENSGSSTSAGGFSGGSFGGGGFSGGGFGGGGGGSW